MGGLKQPTALLAALVLSIAARAQSGDDLADGTRLYAS